MAFAKRGKEMSNVSNRPRSYKGEEPYIFISYSHKDRDEVYKIIRKMQTAGYRVWYDEEIRSGQGWDEVLIRKIKKCDCFIAFVTDAYMESKNCKKEIWFAAGNKEDTIAIVYLEEILKEDHKDFLEFHFGSVQGLFKYEYENDNELFFEKLYETNGIDLCLDSNSIFQIEDPADWAFLEDEEEDAYDVMDYTLHIFPALCEKETVIPLPKAEPVDDGWDSTKQIIQWCGEMAEISVRDGEVWEKDIEECITYMNLAQYHNKQLPAGHKFRIHSIFVDRNNPCNVVHVEYWHDIHVEPLFDEKDIQNLFYDQWEFTDGVFYNVIASIDLEDMHLDYYLDIES